MEPVRRPVVQLGDPLRAVVRAAYEQGATADAPCGWFLGSAFPPPRGRGPRTTHHVPELRRPSAWLTDAWSEPPELLLEHIAPSNWRVFDAPIPAARFVDRRWLADGLEVVAATDRAFAAQLRICATWLDAVCRRQLGLRGAREARRLLAGVTPWRAYEAPFANLYVWLLKNTQLTYVAHRRSGLDHAAAWALAEGRLLEEHHGGHWLESQVARAVKNPLTRHGVLGGVRRGERVRPLTGEAPAIRLTRETLLALTTVEADLWPWIADDGRLLPGSDPATSAVMLGHLLLRLKPRRKRARRPADRPETEAEWIAWRPQQIRKAATLIFAVAARSAPTGHGLNGTPVTFDTAARLARFTTAWRRERRRLQDGELAALATQLRLPDDTEVKNVLRRASKRLPAFLLRLPERLAPMVDATRTNT